MQRTHTHTRIPSCIYLEIAFVLVRVILIVLSSAVACSRLLSLTLGLPMFCWLYLSSRLKATRYDMKQQCFRSVQFVAATANCKQVFKNKFADKVFFFSLFPAPSYSSSASAIPCVSFLFNPSKRRKCYSRKMCVTFSFCIFDIKLYPIAFRNWIRMQRASASHTVFVFDVNVNSIVSVNHIAGPPPCTFNYNHHQRHRRRRHHHCHIQL